MGILWDTLLKPNNMEQQTKTINVEISNITEAQAIALEDMFRTWMSLASMGRSRWTCFYADGDGNFRPKIKVDGKDAEYAPDEIITDEMRKEIWDKDEYRIDFDSIAWKLNK